MPPVTKYKKGQKVKLLDKVFSGMVSPEFEAETEGYVVGAWYKCGKHPNLFDTIGVKPAQMYFFAKEPNESVDYKRALVYEESLELLE